MPKTRNSRVTVKRADGTVVRTARASEFKREPQPMRKDGSPRLTNRAWADLLRTVRKRDGHRCVICKRQAGERDPRVQGKYRVRLKVVRFRAGTVTHPGDFRTVCVRCLHTEAAWVKRQARARVS